MNAFDDVDPDTVLSGGSDWLTPAMGETLASAPLDCIETEYPHYVGSMDSPDDVPTPSEDHAIFYGCFDWHSAVHSHWALVRACRLIDEHPNQEQIIETIDQRVTPEAVEQEVAYFEENPTFEQPYGWGWFLRMIAELELWTGEQATEWREVFQPLEERIVDLVGTNFLTQDRPFRVGTHGNTAFGLQCVLDYARVTAADGLAEDTYETARRFYADDTDAPVGYEPLGWDFLSPSLTEADLMRRVLDREEFHEWMAAFFPDITAQANESILDPIGEAADQEDDLAIHFVGLDLSKAWCLAGIAETLADEEYVRLFEASARRHVDAGFERAFTDDYAGAHWLSSFVLYLCTRNAGGIAPEL